MTEPALKETPMTLKKILPPPLCPDNLLLQWKKELTAMVMKLSL